MNKCLTESESGGPLPGIRHTTVGRVIAFHTLPAALLLQCVPVAVAAEMVEAWPCFLTLTVMLQQ